MTIFGRITSPGKCLPYMLDWRREKKNDALNVYKIRKRNSNLFVLLVVVAVVVVVVVGLCVNYK